MVGRDAGYSWEDGENQTDRTEVVEGIGQEKRKGAPKGAQKDSRYRPLRVKRSHGPHQAPGCRSTVCKRKPTSRARLVDSAVTVVINLVAANFYLTHVHHWITVVAVPSIETLLTLITNAIRSIDPLVTAIGIKI